MKKSLILFLLTFFLAQNSFANEAKKITLISKEDVIIFNPNHSIDVDSAIKQVIINAIKKNVNVDVLDASRDDFEYLVFYQIDDFSSKKTESGDNVSVDIIVKIFKNDSKELYSKNIKFTYKTFMSKQSDIFKTALNKVQEQLEKSIDKNTFK